MSYNLIEIEKLLKNGVPIGTVFDYIMENPYKYCSAEQATNILNDPEYYQEQIEMMRLKGGYSIHLHGTRALKSLFSMGFPETFLTKYVVYPLTYQFRTYMPFIDNIQITQKFPIVPYCSSPII
jgi:hypothetical protein